MLNEGSCPVYSQINNVLASFELPLVKLGMSVCRCPNLFLFNTSKG